MKMERSIDEGEDETTRLLLRQMATSMDDHKHRHHHNASADGISSRILHSGSWLNSKNAFSNSTTHRISLDFDYLSTTISPRYLNVSTFELDGSQFGVDGGNGSSLPPPPEGEMAGVREYIASLYTVICPILIFFCVVTCLVNLVIVISTRWCHKPMSPTLYYSISLALADAYAAFVLGLGLILNTLLPMVYKVQIKMVCLQLTLEAFRQGGVLVTVCHLLALGINHWIGIVRPLHYASVMTRRTAWTVIIASWTVPILMILVYYGTIDGEGFQSQGCQNWRFLLQKTYRGFYASCFFAPLLLLSLIYLHIFIIVRNHQTNRLRYQSTQSLKKNVKAAFTTVLILGTFVVGWMPATLFSIIVCDDCIIPRTSVHWSINVGFGTTVNVLIILKTFLDPIIYAARMSDIQLSLKKMRYDFLRLFCKSCVQAVPPPENTRRSVYESKSVRMSSIGSSTTSSKRAASASLLNHSQNFNGSCHKSANHSQNGQELPNAKNQVEKQHSK